ncbi:MAG: hypothetical protein DMF03_04770 [Verrucomicrobia bacterium]|nr:MAG: hypothetical protein DMF03_04770 [Verrucomicrobiota bacterium]
METELTFKRWTGLAGVAGALLFFCGDMLFYGHGGSGATFHEGMLRVLQQASRTRLFGGGLVGPVAACLCLIGCWHVRENMIGRSPVLGRLVFLALASTMVIGGAVHALWVPRGLAIKYSAVVGAVAPELIDSLRSYWQFAYNLAAAPAYIAAVLLLLLVLLGKTAYPRWTVLANFGVLSLLAPLAERIPAPLGAVVVGGFTNLSIAFFFFISVVSTWKGNSRLATGS